MNNTQRNTHPPKGVCACVDAGLLVIGGGVVGLSTAWAAARAGHRVVVFDPRPLLNDHNASNDESKVFRHAYGPNTPEYLELARRAGTLWRELEAESGRRILHQSGLFLFPGEFADASLRLSPGTRPHRAFGLDGALDTHGGWLDPPQALAALEECVTRRGGSVRRGVGVSRIEAGAARLTDGSIARAQAIVIAAGFHAPELVPELAGKIEVTRQVELFFQAPRGMAPHPTFAAFEEGFYGFPPDSMGACKAADHRKGARVTDFEHRSPPTLDEIDSARAWLARRIPALTEAPLLRWRICLYDNTADDRFLVGASRERARVAFAAGLSGHGFKFGPALGEQLVALTRTF